MSKRRIMVLIVIVPMVVSLISLLLFKKEGERDNGLILWLKFDGNLEDSSIKGYHAQSFCSPLTFKEGVKGQSLYLDGWDDYILIPDKPEFSIVNNPNGMTVSFWMSPANTSFPKQNEYGYIRFLGKSDVRQHEWCFTLYNASNPVNRPYRICVYHHNSTGGLGKGAYVQEPYENNEWIFIVGVIRLIRNDVSLEVSLSIYKNGIWKGNSSDYPGKIIPEDTSSPLCIGKRKDVNEFFYGRIDDFRIYNRALTASEIMNLYNSYFIQDEHVAWVLFREQYLNSFIPIIPIITCQRVRKNMDRKSIFLYITAFLVIIAIPTICPIKIGDEILTFLICMGLVGLLLYIAVVLENFEKI